MAFPARFAGKCTNCGNEIRVGQYITWSRRERGKAYHADCSAPDVKPAAPTTEAEDSEKASIAVEMAEIKAQLAALAAAGLAGKLPATETKALTTKASKTIKLADGAPWYEQLEAICEAFKDDYVRVLLIGPPGTGKSTTAMLANSIEYRVTMTEGMGVEDLIGMYQLIKGETVWVNGPWVNAIAGDKPILCDEVDHHPTEIGSVLYGLLDDKPEIMLPTGERIQSSKKGYKVIATTNSNVTSLPEAILDRFEAILPAITPHPAALAEMPADERAAVTNYFKNLAVTPWQWSGKPTLRRMKAFRKLTPVLGRKNAAVAAFGSAAAEILSTLATASRTGV